MIGTLLRPLNNGFQDARINHTKSIQITIQPYLKVFLKAGRMTTQWVRLDFSQVPDFGKTCNCTLLRKGHFITRLFLVSTLPDISTIQQQAQVVAGASQTAPKFGWTNSIGHALLQRSEFVIGGDTLDTLDSRMLEILDEFNTPLEKVPAVNNLIGRLDSGFSSSSIGYSQAKTVAVPVNHWFARGDSSAALPIDAIGSDLVQLRMTFRGLNSVYYTESRSVNVSQEFCAEGGQLWPIGDSQIYVQDDGGEVIEGLDPNNPNEKWTGMPGFMMPPTRDIHLGDTYLLAEYVYLDKPEANRWRLADIQVPVVQHYIIEPFDTQGVPQVNIPIRVPNPTRALYFMAQRAEAPNYNALFLCTRDLSGAGVPYAPWWPNAVGLTSSNPSQVASAPQKFIPAFALRDSEPITSLSFVYEGNYNRWVAQAPSLFRSLFPGTLFPKSPWVNRYMYVLPFGLGQSAVTIHNGEANMDKLKRAELRLQIAPERGCLAPMQVPRYTIYVYAETYNVFRVYGGRASMLFSQ